MKRSGSISFAAVLAAWALVFVANACGTTGTTPGGGGQRLAISKPAAVSIRRGGMAKADISVVRTNLEGDVTILFTDLPAGVDVVDPGSRIIGDEGAYTLRASDTASLVQNSVAMVTATGPGGISVTRPIDITVTER